MTEKHFTQDTTSGYSDAELAALNAELAERLAALDADAPDWLVEETRKGFSDEVSRRL